MLVLLWGNGKSSSKHAAEHAGHWLIKAEESKKKGRIRKANNQIASKLHQLSDFWHSSGLGVGVNGFGGWKVSRPKKKSKFWKNLKCS